LKKSRLCREISKILDKSRKSRFVSTISICLDDLDKYLDEDKSRPKNLDFKNLDREKKKVDLDRRENLDGFQKLVSTIETKSRQSLDEVSIGLDDFYAIKSRFVSIFIFVSIETLDLDAKKKSVSTVEKISTVFKS